MVFFAVAAEPGALFELHMAALYLALVGVVLGVDIHVLYQVLLLSKRSVANLTNVLLHSTVDGDEVSFQAEATAELFVTASHGADVHALVLLVNLAFDHLVVDLQVLLFHLAVVLVVVVVVLVVVVVVVVFVVWASSHFPILVLISSRNSHLQ